MSLISGSNQFLLILWNQESITCINMCLHIQIQVVKGRIYWIAWGQKINLLPLNPLGKKLPVDWPFQ